MVQPRINKAQRMTDQAFAAAGRTPNTPGQPRMNANTPTSGGAHAARQARLAAAKPAAPSFNGQATRPGATVPPATGGGSTLAPRQGSNFKVAGDLAGLEAQKAKLRPGATNRLGMVDQAIAGLQPQAASNGAAPIPPGGQMPNGEANSSFNDIIENGMGNETGSNDIGNTLFPSGRAFEPENYQGSPLYKFQQGEGEKSIRRALAKRGLLDSGAEIEAISDFNTELGAVESDKARSYADKEADRYERIQQNESLRRERGEGRAGDDMYRWTQLMLDQNPMDYAFSGTKEAAGNIDDSYSANAAYLRERYPRAFASGGGGGGGSGAYVPPFPTGPDYSEIDRLGSLGGSSSGTNYWNAIKNTIAGLF